MNKKSKIITIILLAAAVLISAAIFGAVKFKKPASQQPNGEQFSVDSAGVKPLFKTYTHPGYGFSFDYPADWNATSFSENDGETVLLQNLSASDQRTNQRDISGIQIYISMFDEPETVLTKERILQDLPEMKIANEKSVKIANTIEALSFSSQEQGIGETREVWFIYNGFLYQIMTGAENQEVLEKIIESWKFS